jgi:DNA-binding winged helix-turn-helix (wHTH) protein
VVYRFGDFTLDHDVRQLFRNGEEVHLSPKAFELLTLLLLNRSRAVAKAELQQSLWPSTFVEEANLAGLALEIRRALQDSASHPVFIKTVYGFGYRFIGGVTVDRSAARSEPSRAQLYLEWASRRIVLTEGANVIGRDPDAAIPIDSPGVSRHHARILVSAGAATVEDLGSKNGSHVNGHRITAPLRLSDGDVIRLGAISLTFRIASPTSPTDTLPTGSA